MCTCTTYVDEERGGSVTECLTQDQGVAGLSLTGGTASRPGARHIMLCLILVQPRRIYPDWTDKMLTGHNESNQTNKHVIRFTCADPEWGQGVCATPQESPKCYMFPLE